MTLNIFSGETFRSICDDLASADADLMAVVKAHGYPPMWQRPNTFETLVHIILEQQVSLASALSALNKLRAKVKKITPASVRKLSDAELKACFFSRQKTLYVRSLADALISKKLHLKSLEKMSNDDIRVRLTALKGIGNWTVDVYLMFVLQRADIFPLGDLAAINALKRVKNLPAGIHRDHLIPIVDRWRPHQTVAAMILWHFYLSAPRKIKG